MKVTVLYFAAVRDLVGLSEEIVDLPPGVTNVALFRAWLEGERPQLRGRLGVVRFARNEAFARDDDPVAEGDHLALIPPVAGG